jgi:mono/diheme cytochrome c family protein
MPHLLLLLACLATVACAPPGAEVPGEAARYQTDRAFRRAVLEEALWRPELPYSQSLLSSYALPAGGWDLLPLLDTRVAPFTRRDAEALAAGEALTLDDGVAIGAFAVEKGRDGSPRLSAAEAGPLGADLEAIGRQVFYTLPMRADRYLDWLAARPALWAEVGLPVQADGSVRGLVRFAEADGTVRVGMACGFCHGADGVDGRGERRLDLGRARALYAVARGQAATDEVPAALAAWGPGHVDVTDGALDNPTVIPDLVGLSEARWLNHSGVIRVTGRSTFAVRFETQYILGHRMVGRPDRALMWALAAFVVGLGPEPSEAPEPTEPPAGADVFEARCAGCHVPAWGYGGGLVPAEVLTSDAAVARDPERGTGSYRAPRLLGIGGRAPYLHDGSAATLDGLLAGGHPSGDVLPAADRAALIDFLNTL